MKAKKKKHLEYVLLTEEDFCKLCEKFGPDGAADWIEELDDYLSLSEKNRRKYDNHYRVILVWAKRAAKKAVAVGEGGAAKRAADRFISDLREHASWPIMDPKPRAIVYAVLQTMKRPWPLLRQDLISDPTIEAKLREVFLKQSLSPSRGEAR